MNISNVFIVEVRKLLKNKLLYGSILLSILFASALTYAIKFQGGPFTIRAISGFYGIGATLAIAILCTKMYLDDLASGTISLFFSSKKNRISYLVGKLLAAVFLGFLFGVICSIVMMCSSFFLGWNIKLLSYVILPILIYILFSVFYMLLFFLIGIFQRKPTTIISLAIVFILAIPVLLDNITHYNRIPNVIKQIINNFPLMYLIQGTKFLQLSFLKVIISIISVIVLFVINCYFITRKDY